MEGRNRVFTRSFRLAVFRYIEDVVHRNIYVFFIFSTIKLNKIAIFIK